MICWYPCLCRAGCVRTSAEEEAPRDNHAQESTDAEAVLAQYPPNKLALISLFFWITYIYLASSPKGPWVKSASMPGTCY